MPIITDAEIFAKKEYKKNDLFHQYNHVEEVMNRAIEIAKYFHSIDTEALAIIFHDIDYSSYENHPVASALVAEKFLKAHNYPQRKIMKVKEIILNHSTPHRRLMGEARLLEGKIIYDADKSIFMTNKKAFKKYFPLLYLKETKGLIPKIY